MKRLILPAALVLGACGSSPNFAGNYVGTVTENFDCPNSIGMAAFQIPNEVITLSSNAQIATIASCNLVLENNVSGHTASVNPTSANCPQQSSDGTTITITQIPGGTLTVNGNQLDVTLQEFAIINGDPNCSGTATGTLFLQ